MKVQRIIE